MVVVVVLCVCVCVCVCGVVVVVVVVIVVVVEYKLSSAFHRARYPDRIPVICEKAARSDLPETWIHILCVCVCVCVCVWGQWEISRKTIL